MLRNKGKLSKSPGKLNNQFYKGTKGSTFNDSISENGLPDIIESSVEYRN